MNNELKPETLCVQEAGNRKRRTARPAYLSEHDIQVRHQRTDG